MTVTDVCPVIVPTVALIAFGYTPTTLAWKFPDAERVPAVEFPFTHAVGYRDSVAMCIGAGGDVLLRSSRCEARVRRRDRNRRKRAGRDGDGATATF